MVYTYLKIMFQKIFIHKSQQIHIFIIGIKILSQIVLKKIF